MNKLVVDLRKERGKRSEVVELTAREETDFLSMQADMHAKDLVRQQRADDDEEEETLRKEFLEKQLLGEIVDPVKIARYRVLVEARRDRPDPPGRPT